MEDTALLYQRVAQAREEKMREKAEAASELIADTKQQLAAAAAREEIEREARAEVIRQIRALESCVYFFLRLHTQHLKSRKFTF